MIYPTIHMNGTSRMSLLEGYMDVLVALQEAMDALAKATPNGRDYYPQGPEAILVAQTQHREQMVRLESVAEELMQTLSHLTED